MTLFYTIPDVRPSWFEPALRCAEARSGMPVRVLEGIPDSLKGLSAAMLSARQTKEEPIKIRRFQMLCLMRWPLLLEAARALPDSGWPIYCLDWDMLPCADLREWAARFSEFDFCHTRDRTGITSAAYLFKDIRPLRSFCTAIESAVRVGSPVSSWTNDMDFWGRVAAMHAWKVGDMSRTYDGKTFDHNIGEDGGRFVMDGPRKKIVFENGHPYFFETNGNKVEAVVLHCWSDFKAQMGVFAREMGIAGI